MDRTEVQKLTSKLKSMVAIIEKYLAAGHPPPGIETNPKVNGAVYMCASEMKLPISTVKSRLVPGGICEKMGVIVNWTKYKAREEKVEPLVVRRLSDQVQAAESRAKAAERATITAEGLRTGIFKLTEKPLEPPNWTGRREKSEDKQRESLILMLSDVHMGELVDIAQMGGRNSYNKHIAEARLKRLFANVVKLGTEHWHGPAPDVIYLLLMGDLISGDIHEELVRTNDLMSIPSVQKVSECIIAGINILLNNFSCEIRVVSVPGNHSRTTKKPESKDYAVQSYDTLICWMIESWFQGRNEKRVSFSAPASGDALINIHGWSVVCTHGDKIGSKGGMGFVGPAAAISRGMQKVVQDFASESIAVDCVLMGHFHTSLRLEYGFCNGSLVGPSQYSKTLRMRPLPASQWLLSIHPRYGVSRMWNIHVGSPEEGSIYRNRE